MLNTSTYKNYKVLPHHTERPEDQVCLYDLHGAFTTHGEIEDGTTLNLIDHKSAAAQMFTHEKPVLFSELNNIKQENGYSVNNYMDSSNHLVDNVKSSIVRENFEPKHVLNKNLKLKECDYAMNNEMTTDLNEFDIHSEFVDQLLEPTYEGHDLKKTEFEINCQRIDENNLDLCASESGELKFKDIKNYFPSINLNAKNKEPSPIKIYPNISKGSNPQGNSKNGNTCLKADVDNNELATNNFDECINHDNKELKNLDLIIEQQKLDDFFSKIQQNLDVLIKSNISEPNSCLNINKKETSGIKEDCFQNEMLSTDHNYIIY